MRSLQARLGSGSAMGAGPGSGAGAGMGEGAGVGMRRGNGMGEREDGLRGGAGEVKVKLGVDEGFSGLTGGRGYDDRGFVSWFAVPAEGALQTSAKGVYPMSPADLDANFVTDHTWTIAPTFISSNRPCHHRPVFPPRNSP